MIKLIWRNGQHSGIGLHEAHEARGMVLMMLRHDAGVLQPNRQPAPDWQAAGITARDPPITAADFQHPFTGKINMLMQKLSFKTFRVTV